MVGGAAACNCGGGAATCTCSHGGWAAHAKLAGGFRAECHFLSLFQFSFSTSSLPNPSLSILLRLNKVKREISIIHYKALDIFSIVVGWIYFAAWSISFYPQVRCPYWNLCACAYACM